MLRSHEPTALSSDPLLGAPRLTTCGDTTPTTDCQVERERSSRARSGSSSASRQGNLDDARETFDRVIATSNGLGLFGEEFDPGSGRMLGNFPQALTHLAHIEASLALDDARRVTL